MKRIIVVIATVLCLLVPSTAFAGFNPLGSACASNGGAASSSAVCGTNGSDPISGKNGALEKATEIIASIAGVAAVIIIVIAGLTYVTSGGNSQRIENARTAIIGAVVGLIIIALASAIVAFVAGRV